MNEPQVEVLGLFQLPVTDELFREQFDILYGYPMSKRERAQAERQYREQLSSIVLVDAMVRNRDDKFDIGKFTQPQQEIGDGSGIAMHKQDVTNYFLSKLQRTK